MRIYVVYGITDDQYGEPIMEPVKFFLDRRAAEAYIDAMGDFKEDGWDGIHYQFQIEEEEVEE